MLGFFLVFDCKNYPPQGDVVFVHGLAGHPWGTWHPQNKKDKEDVDFLLCWLGEELQAHGIDVNVWSFGYDAPGFQYFGQGMPRFDLASNLLEYLQVYDIGKTSTSFPKRPLIFVTHSLGGLVVKEVIRTAQSFPEYLAIVKQVKGIVFLSTPHTGTHLANLIDHVGFLTRPTVNVEELKEHSPQLRDLNEWYRQNVGKLEIKTKVFYETKSLNGVLVVNEDSANPGIHDVKPIAVSAEDHNSIAKPGKNDLVYLSVRKFCQDIFALEESTSSQYLHQKYYIPGEASLENKVFVGREKELADVDKLLKNYQRVSIVSVSGMGGVGKTELCRRYAYAHKSAYPGGICWLEAPTENAGIQILRFAQNNFQLVFSSDQDLPERLRYCWQKWSEGNTLLIYNDVTDYNTQAKPFLPPDLSRFRVLLTTRKSFGSAFPELRLDVLKPLAGMKLLRSILGRKRLLLEPRKARELLIFLGYLPLGIELVGRYLDEYWQSLNRDGLALTKMLKRLERKSLEHQAMSSNELINYPYGVAEAIALSWEMLDENTQEIGLKLGLYALAPIRLWWDGIEDDEELEGWEIALGNLENLHLLKSVEPGVYILHSLVREFLQMKLKEYPRADELKRGICQVVAEAARNIPDNITVEQVKEVEVDIPHITEVAAVLTEYLSDDDLISPFNGLGRFYLGQALYSQAQLWLETGKEIAEKRLDKDNADIGNIYNSLALLYKSQGKYEAAEPLYLQAIETAKIALPENHPSIATGLNNLANLYYSQGKYEAAEPLYLQALEIKKIALPENHPQRASGLNNLAGLYYSQGKYEAAEPLYLQALEIDKIALPENHPQFATHLNNLAKLYRSQGKYEAAEPLYLQALEIDKIALPENHPQFATHLNNLAKLYRSQGKYEAAEPLYLQALEINKIALPENHPDIATDLNNLALLYESQGKYEAAEPLYLQALKILKQSLGEEHPNTQTVQKNYQNFLNEKK
ncbi:NB-ARC [Trichodesmium erythraeum IMS101]|uniref:NB-ARC n=1 Tax=Trichodesmium erythraeum (strain IMS101) TaxID=203124 RepID=Q114J5_TRIEI